MDLNIATLLEASILKRALYARLATVQSIGHVAGRASDALAHRAAQMEEHTLRILLENTIQVERCLMDRNPPDLDQLLDLQRPG